MRSIEMVRRPEENPCLMKAVDDYLNAKGLFLPANAKYEYIIDGVFISVNGLPVLTVGLPPVSNYPVDETEHTYKYLKKKELSAS
jgi:hypothetical protein